MITRARTRSRRWLARTGTTALLALTASLLPTPFAGAFEDADPGTIASIDGAERTAFAADTLPGDSGFGEKNRFVGRLGYSADGLGQFGSGGSVQADVPAGATVRLAYLYGTYFVNPPSLAQRTISFAGQNVVLTTIPSNAGSFLSAARADVTAQVTTALGGGSGVRNFRIGNDPSGLDGVALLVVFEHPDLPVSTIAVVDGGASQSGQRTTLTFAAPLDPGVGGFSARMSLGIGFGFQGSPGSICGTGARQSSIIDVNDRGLTSCAGNFDDGGAGNGALITVGGVGDSLANPADPFQQPADGRFPRVQDDELYDLAPFVTAGDRTLEIESANPSFDDIIFLTVIAITARIETVVSVPIGQTFGTGSGPHAGNPTGYQSDPVNSRTGFFVTTATDAVLPARGPALRLDRTYNSGDDAVALLGRGWSSAWDVRLQVDANAVTLVAEDGQRVAWERGLGGSLTPPSGARSTLSAVSGGYELVRRDGVRYRFDPAGLLLSLRDANGLGFAVERAAGGAISAVVDDAGRRTTFEVSGGRLTSAVLPDGRAVRYGYDGTLLTSVTDVRGGTTRYGYDAAGRLATVTDQNGTVLVTNTYGPTGRVVRQVDAAGAASTFAWDEATLTSTMTDAVGGAWRDVYDEDGRLAKRIDPLGGETAFQWDGDLNLVAVTDPAGDVTSYTYDDRGNLLEAAGGEGAAATFAYDAANNLASSTDPNGGTTTYAHDANRNLVAVTGPLGDIARVEYADGLPARVTDRRGNVTRLEHDAAGNMVRTVAPGGAVTAYAYDGSGRVSATTDATGRRTAYAYDAAGNLLSVTDAAGNVSRFAYDAAGRRVSSTDANGGTRGYRYDAAGRLTVVTAADGGTTTYAYDAAGRTVSRTDGNGNATTYAHDAAGRVTAVTLPTGETWRLAYDAAGNAVEARTPNGLVRLGYDALDRLVGIDYADATPDVTIGYDRNGNRTSVHDGAGLRTFAYDAENRLVAAARDGDVFRYAYDAAGNVVERAYPDGRTVGYEYTSDGLLAAVTAGADVTRYAYDAAGRLTRTALPNGTAETRGYDAAGRLTDTRHLGANGKAFDGATATLDAVGNPVAVRAADGGRTATYAYDAEHRLVEACFAASCPAGSNGAARIRYSYDAAGNRVAESRPEGTTAYDYDAADRLLRTRGPRGTTEYSYDANGNRTRAGDTEYAYDLANRLVHASVPGAGSVDYTYDSDGVLRTAGDTEYLWDVAAPSPLLALTRGGDGTTGYVHGHDLVSAGDSFAHQDALGTVTSQTDAAGHVRARYEYDPFGAVTRSSGRDGDTGPAVGFAGMPRDAVTGLVQTHARAFDPATGTFLQRDPVAAGAGAPAASAYGWVGNRPTVLADPTGQCPWCVLAGVGAVVGGIVGGAAYALTTDDFEWREFGGAVAGGAVAGAIVGVAGPLGGSVATAFGASSTGALATGATLGISALGGAAGTTAQTYLGQGRPPTAGELALGAGAAAAGTWVGGLFGTTRGMTTIAQTRYFGPRTWSSLVSGKPNISALYRSAAAGGFLELGLNYFGNDLVAPSPSGGK